MRNIAIYREKFIDIIFYVMYARLLLEAHETMVLSSTVEIRELQSDSAASTISHLIAWGFLALCLILPSVALYLFYKNQENYDPDKKTVTMEFFAGLRNTRWARLYTFTMLARRVAFVLLIIFLSRNVHRVFVYTPILLIQISYCSFMVISSCKF